MVLVYTSRPARGAILILALLIPLGFAWFTSHIWEDYFITLRSSRNLVEGHGLVFNPGERVHTFTSPLGVLVPALCTWIAGVNHEETAIWIFRLINAACLMAGAALVYRRFEEMKIAVAARLLFFGLLLFDGKLIDFSINGMETAMVVFFLLLLWSELETSAKPRAGILAVCFGGVMWARPDGFVLAGALLLPYLIFRQPPSGKPAISWKPLIGGLVLGALIYLPWFAWAWWYYGSPVPNTIVAKAAYTPPLQIRELLLMPWYTLTGESQLKYLFLPSYWMFGSWPSGLIRFAQLLSIVATFAWLIPGLSASGRRAGLAIFLGMFYLCSIPLFPWYVPPWSVLASLALCFVFNDGYTRLALANRIRWLQVMRMGCALVVGIQVATFAAVAWQMRILQQAIENDGRRDIGLWLKQHAQAGDTIFLEPLGYIGYYSGLKTYDFPGLSSPEVIAAYKSGITSYAALIEKLQPTWVVLRPQEIGSPQFQTHPVLNHYVLANKWDARPALDRVSFLPGRKWGEFDSGFLLYRKKPENLP